MEKPERLFIGCYPTGFVFSDKKKQEYGDYMQIAYINYNTLELKFHQRDGKPKKINKECEEYIKWYHSTLKPGQCTRIAMNMMVVLGSEKLTKKEHDEAYLKGYKELMA